MTQKYSDADIEDFSVWTAGEMALIDGQRWRDVRAAGPITKSVMGATVIRHADVCPLLRDKRLRGIGMDFSRMVGVPESSLTWRFNRNFPLFMDGEDHRRVRSLVAKAFTPRAVEALRPYTRSVIRGLVDAVFDTGRCDAASSLCDPFPIPVICALIGVEPDRIDDMSRWSRAIVLALRVDAAAFLDQVERAQGELNDYVAGLISARRLAPRDDLLSRLIAAEEAGDRLSHDELLAMVAGLLVAGTDTTRNQLTNVIHTFATHPNEWALLRAKPELVPRAIEEAIRFQPASRSAVRVTLEEIELGGVAIPPGSMVGLVTYSANHDESALANPERFDITRQLPDEWQLTTFGGGAHYCIGANLARLELTEALSELSGRFEKLRLDGEPQPTSPESPFVGYQSLPIAWN